MSKNAIYIFTCNRSFKLEKLLRQVASIENEYSIFIIDDTSEREIIEQNKRIAKTYRNVTYLGAIEFSTFYKLNEQTHVTQLLGDTTWNLGIARNFALEHSILHKFEKILFIDDDISGVDEILIEKGFSTVNNSCFVSCLLNGLEDDSIVGRIAKQVDVIDHYPRMLSGGFLFLTPVSISHKFLNIYNEDWILQLLEKEKKQITLPYTVWHNVGQEVNWTLEQVVFQELGELVVKGLFENDNALSMDFTFWDGILENRIKFIMEIHECALKVKNEIGHDICEKLLNWLKQFDGHSLQQNIEQKKSKSYEYKI